MKIISKVVVIGAVIAGLTTAVLPVSSAAKNKDTVTLESRGGTGGGALTYSTSTPAICSVSTSGELKGLSVGNCSVAVTKGSDSNYLNTVSSPKVFAVRP